MNINCIFCKIINKEIESKLLFENNTLIVFLDASPSERGHCLIVSKKHKKNILELTDEELTEIVLVQKKITKLIQKKLNPKGFNFLNNFNPIAGQAVEHYHLHIIPKYKKNEGFHFSSKKTKNKINLNEIWEILKK